MARIELTGTEIEVLRSALDKQIEQTLALMSKGVAGLGAAYERDTALRSKLNEALDRARPFRKAA